MRVLAIALLSAAILGGCASGKKALKQGDYDKAFYQAVNRLQSNDDHKKARETLVTSYRLALRLHQDRVNLMIQSLDPFKWENVVYEYNAINGLYNQLQRCPACLPLVKNPVRVTSKLNEAKQSAADYRYQLGNEAMRFKQDRNKAKEAHQHFRMVRSFIPNYKDTREKMEEALYFAMVRVVVEPIPSPTRAFDINQEFFTNKVNEYLHNNQISPYVRFYTPGEVDRSDPDWVDHVIQMRFDRFNLGNVSSNTYVENISRDSVVIQTRGDEKIYGTVKAKLKVYTKSISGSGVLDFKIRDLNLNKVISQEKFPSQYDWTARWATFNGDERALSEEQKDLVNRIEMDIPGPQRMFEEFTAPLYDQVIRKVNAYYRNY